MSKNVRHKSYSDTLKDKREEKRQRQYARMRDNNECGNNLWQRKDDKNACSAMSANGRAV